MYGNGIDILIVIKIVVVVVLQDKHIINIKKEKGTRQVQFAVLYYHHHLVLFHMRKIGPYMGPKHGIQKAVGHRLAKSIKFQNIERIV